MSGLDYGVLQGQAQRGGTQANQCAPHGDGDQGSGQSGGSAGDFAERAAGAIRAGGTESAYGFLLGGIVAQLITDAEDRLGEVRECVDWYRREEEKVLKRISDLRQLQQLATESLSAESQSESE